jgi:hypothetical protein
MKQVIVNIPNKNFHFFMKLMKSLDFVKIVEPAKTLEEQLTPEQLKTWKNIKQGFIELKLSEEGKLTFRPIEDLINEL